MVNYSVAPDPTNPRTGQLTIAGLTFTVNQAGVVPGYLGMSNGDGRARASCCGGGHCGGDWIAGKRRRGFSRQYLHCGAAAEYGLQTGWQRHAAHCALAGTGRRGIFVGDSVGPLRGCAMLEPAARGVAVDASGDVFIADSGNRTGFDEELMPNGINLLPRWPGREVDSALFRRWRTGYKRVSE